MTGIIEEAKRLYLLGFGVHWTKRKNNKLPVEMDWANGTRQKFSELKSSYKNGYGLGVRLGKASKLKDDTYLVNIDVDIKAGTAEARKEALEKLDSLFPGLRKNAPAIKTGTGIRFLAKTDKPCPFISLAKSTDKCKYKVEERTEARAIPDYVTKGLVSLEDFKAGWRLRPSWEIDLMGNKRQAVFPPSIHPETKKPYKWIPGRSFTALEGIPLIPIPDQDSLFALENSDENVESREGETKKFLAQWKPKEIDIHKMDIDSKWVRVIEEGADDNSAAAHSVAMALLKAGVSIDDAVSILTDPGYELGKIGYRHAKTKNRKRAARWVYRFCIRKAKKNVMPEEIFSAPFEDKELSPEEAKAQAEEIAAETDWTDKLQRGKKGKLINCYRNTALILKHAFGEGCYAHDEFANRDFFAREMPWCYANETIANIHPVRIKDFFSTHYGYEPAVTLINEALLVLCNANVVNPVQDFFRSLPPWDGEGRLEFWLQRNFGARGEDMYIGEVFTKWMVAAVSRAFEPGMKFDWIMIFEGAQGQGKSLFGRILFGAELFDDNLPPLDYGTKEATLHIQGKLCIELAELTSLTKGGLDAVKAFVTRQSDRTRIPYLARTEDHPRRCIFYGTTNRSTYLRDETGNRRFNPIPVGQLNVAALRRDRLQLWAEAYFLYQNCLIEHFYLSGQAKIYAEEIQREKKEYSELDHFIELILEWNSAGNAFNWKKFRVSDLFSPNSPLENQKHDAKNTRIARDAIEKMGAQRKKSGAERFYRFDDAELATHGLNTGAPTGVMLN